MCGAFANLNSDYWSFNCQVLVLKQSGSCDPPNHLFHKEMHLQNSRCSMLFSIWATDLFKSWSVNPGISWTAWNVFLLRGGNPSHSMSHPGTFQLFWRIQPINTIVQVLTDRYDYPSKWDGMKKCGWICTFSPSFITSIWENSLFQTTSYINCLVV